MNKNKYSTPLIGNDKSQLNKSFKEKTSFQGHVL